MTSVFFITQGCSANVADSEQMKGLLKEAKFEIAQSLEEANVVVINSCTVKNPTESTFYRKLEELKKEHPYKIVVIAGCIAQADAKKLKKYSLVGTKQIHRIVEIVEEALHDNVVHALETGEMPPLDLPKVRKNPVVEIIPINRGCLSACTFCKTKYARGNLVSYPVEDIVKIARKGVKEGIKEIWLTSQDTMCYGFDIDTDLPTLLEELVKIPGQFKIRVGMGNPVHIPKIKDRLFSLFNHEKVFKFAHIPIQAGSNKVLEDMKRGNTREDFEQMINELKQICPTITIATDIIVGYPTETEEDYWETLEMTRRMAFDVINISRFWARPRTPAAKLKQLQGDEVKRRSKVLTDIFHNISTLQNEKWLGWKGKILIDDYGREEGQFIGRNDSYKQVIVKGNFSLGDFVDVKIVKTDTFHLMGEEA